MEILMTKQISTSKRFLEQTKSAFLWTRLLNIPFWAIFNMLSVILYKDLQATPLQIAAIIALKPLASLFSPYWSASIYQRQDKLVSNLVWANILKFLPFLLFPWFTNNWLFIASFGFYMALARGVIPAWMEIIKLNIQGTAREKIFATGSALDYLGTAILPIAFGWILDDYTGSWRWIFFGTALIGIFSTLLLYQIPVAKIAFDFPASKPILSEVLLKPWKQSWNLVKERPDFLNFQIGFMLGGSGLIIMQTVLPMFFVDDLKLNYTTIFVALTVCKGIGFACSSPFWVKWFDRTNIYRFSSLVTLLAATSPLILIGAKDHIVWLYAAYIVYGIMQAGSELSWHLSGPLFAQDKDSSIYSGTNILTVGIRGCIAPLVGNLIYTTTNSMTVMIISSFLCLLATERMRHYGKATYENLKWSTSA